MCCDVISGLLLSPADVAALLASLFSIAGYAADVVPGSSSSISNDVAF